MGPFDWSLDGRWIAVALARKDRTGQIGLVSAADGSLRVLKSVNWQGSSKLAFSPDGRYLAYDLPQSDTGEERDVFVMAIDGSRETAVIAHPADDKILAWTPDGRHLLFATNRSGPTAIMAQPLREGRASGSPVFVKSDVGSPMPLGMSSAWALFFGVNSRGPSVQLASFDAAAGSLTPSPQPLQLVGASEGPAWSPDGNYLAYISRRLTSSFRFNNLAVRSIATGETRELRPQLTYFQNVRWAPDGRSVAVRGTDLKGREGSYRIDVRSGEVSELVPNGFSLQWATDGERVYFNRIDGQRRMNVIVERHLSSGSEREIKRFSNAGPITLSPDGRHLAIRVLDRASKSGMLHVVDLESGGSRELIKFNSPAELGNFIEWTSDGRSVVVTKNPDSSGNLNAELWVVPLEGEPRQVKTSLRDVRGYRFQPGGNQVAFSTQPPAQAEVWVMENFLPALGAKE
jgi:Tol biopolymer transport system component